MHSAATNRTFRDTRCRGSSNRWLECVDMAIVLVLSGGLLHGQKGGIGVAYGKK
jgi:hypothetical protein